MSSFGVFCVLLVATFATNGSCDEITNEANLLALEASEQLLAPELLPRKVAEELKAIRAAYPAVKNIVFSPSWNTGELFAMVTNEQLVQIRNEYGEVTSKPVYKQTKKLTFTTKYNPEVLAQELKAKNLVILAEPVPRFGEDDNIEYNVETGIYTFYKGWDDCFSSCINNHYWDFYVSGSKGVQLLKEYGSPLEVESLAEGYAPRLSYLPALTYIPAF